MTWSLVECENPNRTKNRVRVDFMMRVFQVSWGFDFPPAELADSADFSQKLSRRRKDYFSHKPNRSNRNASVKSVWFVGDFFQAPAVCAKICAPLRVLREKIKKVSAPINHHTLLAF